MIKIAYLIPSLYNPGGMERILTDKINYLVESGEYEVFVITTDQNNKKPFFFLHEKVNFINLNIDFHSVFNKKLITKYFLTRQKYKAYSVQLKEFLDRNQIQICISTGGKELEFLYKLNVGCKKICELHFSQSFREQFINSRKNNFFWKLIGKLRTRMLIKQTKSLDKLVVLTKSDLEIWRKTHSNVCQIYNFVSTNNKTFPAYERKKKVIAIGRLDAQKGFDLLVEAWSKVNENFPDWQLEIYGKGEWEDKLKKLINDRNLNNVVFLRGVTNDVSSVFLSSSIFVLSSRYEGFPMVLLESLFYETPIVSFDCKTGPSEIIINNDCGILVPESDVNLLAEGINNLITNESLRLKMGSIAKEKSYLFGKQNIMSQWDKLFKEIVYYENTNR